MSGGTSETMKIIKPPAPLEYTEVTESVAQALRIEVKVFLRVLCALQGAARVVKFIFSKGGKRKTALSGISRRSNPYAYPRKKSHPINLGNLRKNSYSY